MRGASLVLAGVLAATASAQSCPRPDPPAGGHPLQFDLVVPVTYTDGYHTFGTLVRPSGPAPSCGWPVVVFVHPLGQDRSYEQGLQLEVAGQGYAVWTYDVRGHGQALGANLGHVNAGSTVWGPAERLDLAEQIAFVAGNAAWSGDVDGLRVAVAGISQGGAHAWQAAAWSERLVQAPGRPPRVMPRVSCSIAMDLVADSRDDWFRDGILFSTFFTNIIAGAYAYTGVPFDAGFVQAGRAAFLAQDAAALVAAHTAEERVVDPYLLTTAVPVLYSHAYHDFIADPLSSLVAMRGMAAPHRAILGTIGHGTPANVAERTFRDALVRRWLDRFLWGQQNEVEFERPYVLAQLPLSAAERDDVSTAWGRTHCSDPLQAVNSTRYFLHDDAALREVAPVAPQAIASIEQTLDPQVTNFTPTDYLDQPAVRDLANVLVACPLSERAYSLTTSAEAELTHSAAVHLRIVPDRPEWMLAALLTVQPPEPGAAEVMLASCSIATRSSAAGVAEDRTFLLPPVAVRIPAGAIVRLRLRNLWLNEHPMTPALAAAPLFHDFRVDVVHGDVPAGSWIDLPLAPVRPTLVTTTSVLDLATMDPLDLQLRGGAARGGFPFFLAVGMSGQLPATPYLNEMVPIELDWLVGASVGSSLQPYFTGFLGFLDASGATTGHLDLSSIAPLPTFLSGTRVTCVGFVWDDQTAASGASTNACDVLLR